MTAEQPDTEESLGPGSHPEPYSIFTPVQKRWIIFMIASTSVFSPLSSFIYYPAISSIAGDLGVSVELINITITSYMIVSGIAPAIIGDIADIFGRRPAYILILTVYLAANLGLGAQKSYSALLILRMVQSFGSSGTISVAYGVVADISIPAERGSYVGAVLCGPNVAPSLGPVLGGVLAEQAGWRWIFWFLSIISGVCLASILVFLPETARQIVGNGSVEAECLNKRFLEYFSAKKFGRTKIERQNRRRRLHVPNPITCLQVLFYKDTFLIVLINAVFYTTYCCVQASLASLVINIYHLTEVQAGLIYLPFGSGCALAAYLTGRVMDRDFRITAKLRGVPVEETKGHDVVSFPIEEARFRSIWIPIAVSVASTTGYGWSLDREVHLAVPLILQFFMGFMISPVFNMCGTLLVDLYPRSPATAQASNNIVRCFMSAGGLALLQILIDRLGVGWCFTLFAGLCSLTIPMVLAEKKWGMQWRAARESKLKAREALRKATTADEEQSAEMKSGSADKTAVHSSPEEGNGVVRS
ncbi:hypothetical protein MMC17_006534 [Xylographa soralifera]|nr:hypothetical protein [Xylographa soralifera]